jgi:hypothetical protein
MAKDAYMHLVFDPRFIIFFAICVASIGARAELLIYPPQPAQGSTIKIEGMSGCFGNPVEFSIEGLGWPGTDRIIKIYDPGYIPAPLLPCPPSKANRIVLGPVSAGRYRVERYERSSASTQRLIETTSFVVTAKANAYFPADWAGLWWVPDQPGWAILIDRDPTTGHIFAAWYTHEGQNNGGSTNSVWVFSSNMSLLEDMPPAYFAFSRTSLSGDVEFAQGNHSLLITPSMNGATIPPFSLSITKVGTMTLDFNSSTEATLSWTIGVAGGVFSRAQFPGAPTITSGSARMRKFAY